VRELLRVGEEGLEPPTFRV